MITDYEFDFSTVLQDMTTSGFFAVDRRLNVIFWNRFMELHSQLKSTEILNQSLVKYFPELKEDWFAKKVRSVMVLGNQSYTNWDQRPYLLHFPSTQFSLGKIEHMYQNCAMWPLQNSQGNVMGVCVSIHDVTEMAISQKLLEDATEQALTYEETSNRDELTGLYNRKYFFEQLSHDIGLCKRYNWELVHAIIDVDHFKAINDSYGHLVGDEVLIELGMRIQACLRVSDTLCRLGGEEFAILLPNLSKQHMSDVLERIRFAVEKAPFEADGNNVNVTVSIGAALFDINLSSKDNMNIADKALYIAKNNGRNQVNIFHF